MADDRLDVGDQQRQIVALLPLRCVDRSNRVVLLQPGAVKDDDVGEEVVDERGRARQLQLDGVIVDAFDIADGVVAIPPADVRPGLPVDPVFNAEFASNGGFDGASR